MRMICLLQFCGKGNEECGLLEWEAFRLLRLTSAVDRLFWSVLDTWKSVTTLSADVKELTPEFYSTDPAFLLNLESINFGTRASGASPLITQELPWLATGHILYSLLRV